MCDARTNKALADELGAREGVLEMADTTNAQPLALQIILDEHRSIRSALDAIVAALPSGPKARGKFDLGGVQALLAYLDGFPDQVHHPKEDEALFSVLAEHDREGDDYLQALRREHEYGEHAMRTLQAQADALRSGDASLLSAFCDSVRSFDTFYRAHMHLEEEVLLPRALNVLSTEHWVQIDAAFATNLDPLQGGRNTLAFANQLRGALERLHRPVDR